MRIRVLASICSFSVILLLAGCGGGGGDAPAGAGSEDTSDAATREALLTTNLAFSPPGSPAFGTLKRWNLPIPVKTNDVPRAVQAINAIEDRLGPNIFDRTSIANDDDASITRGMIVSVGTADPTSPICGAADRTDGSDAVLTGKFFVHIDSPGCTATVDATIHEFAHTMGMFGHFQNFGNGAPIGELFWRVLRTIYLPANSPGTPGPNVVLAP